MNSFKPVSYGLHDSHYTPLAAEHRTTHSARMTEQKTKSRSRRRSRTKAQPKGKKLKEPKVNPKRTQPNRKQLRRSQKKLKELKELKEIQAKRKHFTLLCVQWKRRHFDVLAKGRGEGGVERGVLCLGFRLVWLKNGCEFAVGIRSTIWATARRMNKSEKFHKFS